jgi:hypothetical protein
MMMMMIVSWTSGTERVVLQDIHSCSSSTNRATIKGSPYTRKPIKKGEEVYIKVRRGKGILIKKNLTCFTSFETGKPSLVQIVLFSWMKRNKRPTSEKNLSKSKISILEWKPYLYIRC